MTNDDEGEGGGVTIPPKNDDVIYEQPLRPLVPILSRDPMGTQFQKGTLLTTVI